MPEFDDELEAELGARFGALRGGVSAVPVPEAGDIVVRGRRRRRNGQAIVAGIAVLGAVSAGFLALGPLRSDRPQLNGSGSGAGRSASASPYAPPAGASREPVGLSIPPGFVPRDGLANVREGLSAAPGPQCAGRTAFVRVHEALVAARSWEVAGTPGRFALYVYSNGSLASAAFHEYEVEAGRCATGTTGGVAWTKQVEHTTLGAESIRVTTRFTKPTGAAPPSQVLFAVRWGGSVLVVEGPETVPVQRNAELLERRLCTFARDCAPRDGRPSPISELAVGQPVVAVVLAVDVDPLAPELGRAIAAASEMGYRTSVASIDCDQDARRGLGLSVDSPYSYVAVYFDRQADANDFAAHSMVPTVATITVRTFCLG